MAVLTAGTLWPITDEATFRLRAVYNGPYLRADLTNPNMAPFLFPHTHKVRIWNGTAWVLAPTA